MNKLFILCGLGLMGSFSSAQTLSEAQFPASLVRNWINTKDCNLSDTALFACAQALNAMNGDVKFISKWIPAGFPIQNFGYVVQQKTQQGPMQWILAQRPWADTAVQTPSDSALWMLHKSERDSLVVAFRELHQKGIKWDIEDALDQVERKSFKSLGRKAPLLRVEGINAYLARTEDPHTYLRLMYDVQESASGTEEYGGFGFASLVHKGRLYVRQMFPGTPAHKKLRPGDQIIALNNKSVRAMGIDKAMNSFRGKVGTDLAFTVLRDGKTLKLTLKRAQIEVENVRFQSEQTPNGALVHYLKLNTFEDPRGCNKFGHFLDSMARVKSKGLILDLRGNGGGLIDEAVCMAGLFVGPKLISQARPTTADGIVYDYNSTSEVGYKGPMVVLIDAESASASELLSGALQDYRRAWVLGQRSFGKGSMQEGTPWSPAVLKFKTKARYYLPSGRSTQLSGVTPDFILPMAPEEMYDGVYFPRESDLYDNALLPAALASEPARIREATALRNCVQDFKPAHQRYLDQRKAQSPTRDYERAAALDLLDCIQK